MRVRLNQIIDSHRLALANLYDLLMEPKVLPECFNCMFGREIGDDESDGDWRDGGAPELSVAPRLTSGVASILTADTSINRIPEARYIDAE